MRLKSLVWITLSALFVSGVVLLTGCQNPRSSTDAKAQVKMGIYQVLADLPAPGLKVQRETYTLWVKDITGQPVKGRLRVQVSMPMDHGPVMSAPTTLTPQSTPGAYTVQTEFTMAGDWTLRVQPTPSAEPVVLTLSVADS